MADFGDKALTLQEQLLADAMRRQGLKAREIEIPAPHYDPPPAINAEDNDDHSA